MDNTDNMDIIDVYGKKYIKQSPPPPSSSDVLRPLTSTKPIDIINPLTHINSIKPIFSCDGQCDKCKDKKGFNK
jgi:hypothetical protein